LLLVGLGHGRLEFGVRGAVFFGEFGGFGTHLEIVVVVVVAEVVANVVVVVIWIMRSLFRLRIVLVFEC
jgi:hypothetical protein